MRTILMLLSALFAVYSVMVFRVGDGEATGEVRAGMRIWQEQNCQGCHQLYGLGGYMGPDLTDEMSVRGATRVRTFVRYGTGRMPAHALSDTEIDQLVAFLAWVDSSGDARVPSTAVHWTGTYLIEQP